MTESPRGCGVTDRDKPRPVSEGLRDGEKVLIPSGVCHKHLDLSASIFCSSSLHLLRSFSSSCLSKSTLDSSLSFLSSSSETDNSHQALRHDEESAGRETPSFLTRSSLHGRSSPEIQTRPLECQTYSRRKCFSNKAISR